MDAKKNDDKITQLFSNMKVLDETPNQKALKNQTNAVNELCSVLCKYINDKRKCIIAYTAPHGTGKSVIINNVIKSLETKGPYIVPKKIDFDIWQYNGDDKKIWDAFSIEVISAIDEGRSKKSIIKRIDIGKINICTMVLVLIFYVIISLVSWLIVNFIAETYWLGNFLRSFLKYAAPVAVALFGISSFLPTYSTPLSRKSQYEEELLKAIKRSGRPIVITIEDVDRCLDEKNSRIFLEELHSFIERNQDDIEHALIVVCPQESDGLGSLENEESRAILDNNLKIYDEVFRAPIPSQITEEQIDELLNAAACTRKDKIKQILVAVLKASSRSGSILNYRTIKTVLREVASFIDVYPDANIDLATLFSVSRYSKVSTGFRETKALSAIFKDGSQQHYGNMSENMKGLFSSAFVGLAAMVRKKNTQSIIIIHDKMERAEYEVKYNEKTRRIEIVIDDKYSTFFFE